MSEETLYDNPEESPETTEQAALDKNQRILQTDDGEILISAAATTSIEPTPFSSAIREKEEKEREEGRKANEKEREQGQEQESEQESEQEKFTSTNTEAIEISTAEEREPLKISCYECQQKLDVTYLMPFAHFNCPSCNTDLIVPKWFDNYLLEEPGGAGGMATVYRALDLALDREVAIKILNPEVASTKERSELFLHEARTAATINHYAVIPIYTCGEFEGQPYIIMQYMSGGSLEHLLKLERNGLPEKDVVKWIRDIAEGLDNAKRHGIIHHDIKPGNIMLDSENNAKIGDFGIAQAVNDTRTDKIFEMTKAWVSPHYVSPEKVINGKEDFRGDIYSLGATFYHLITGFTPFDHNDMDELIRLRLRKDPIAPHHHKDEISPEISRVVLSMMERDPEKRPNYREIVKTLSVYLKGSAKKRKTMSQSIRRTKTTLDMDKLNASIAEKAGIKEKKPTLLIINTVLLILIAAVAVFGWQTGRIQSFLGLNVSSNPLEENKVPADLIPEASEAFSNGNSKKAADIARQALEDVNAGIDKRKQAAVMLSLSDYLNKNRHAKDNCSFIIERLVAAEVDDADSHLAIIRFLEKPEISPEALNAKLSEDKYLRLVGLLATFLRDVYNNKPAKDLAESYAAYYAASSSMKDDNYWGNAWKKRLPLWKEAVVRKIGNKNSLEPLFAARVKSSSPLNILRPKRNAKAAPKPQRKTSRTNHPPKNVSNVNLSNLNASWLSAHRRFAAKRPKPTNFVISSSALDNYLKSLPGNKRKIEQQRSQIVFSVKEYLCGLMRRIPFKGDSITLKNGKALKGRIMANMRGLQIKTSGGKRMRLNWTDISVDQFIKFVLFYIETRRDALNMGAVGKAEKKEIGEDYFKLALFCDWYGKYGLAANYAKEAAKYNPSIAGQIQEYILN